MHCTLEQFQLSPAAAGGIPSAPATLSQHHTCISFVHPPCNYEDLHGNFLCIPRLVSACSEFKAALPASQGIGIGCSGTKSAGRFAEPQRGGPAPFYQLIKSLKSVFMKSIEENPRISGRRGQEVVMEKNPLLNHTEM